MFTPKMMDFSKTKTFSAQNRHNLVRIDNLRNPCVQNDDLFHSKEFDILVTKLQEAKSAGRSVTCFIGAHVIKCGLSRYLIWLMENGYITHLASNGAGSITILSSPIWAALPSMSPLPLKMAALVCGRKPDDG